VAEDVKSPGGWVAIPAGATVHGTITEVSPAQNTRSTGSLTLGVSSVTVAGSRYDIDASIDALETVNEGRGIETVDAARVAGGAAAGAILGRVIGGNAKGTIIGGVAGGAAGAAVSVAMKDMDIVLPAGSHLRLTLRRPLSLTARWWLPRYLAATGEKRLVVGAWDQGDRAAVASDGVKTIKEGKMLWTIAIILLVLWVLGLVSSYTIGGLIHVLLVVAIVIVLLRLIQGRKIL
jgi:hypothetical protein